MTKRGLYKLVFALLLSVYGHSSHAQEKELRVFYKPIEGECLYEKKWNKVFGNIVSWDITDITSSRLIDSHSYKFLKYKSTNLSKGQLPKLRYFQYLDHSRLYEISPLPSTFEAELSFLNQKKKELGSSELELARLIFETDEHTLAGLNSLNEGVSFKKFSYESVLIPGGLTVCKLKVNTLMDGAKAIFKTNFFGGVTIKLDKTISIKPEKKSFAVELLKRHY